MLEFILRQMDMELFFSGTALWSGYEMQHLEKMVLPSFVCSFDASNARLKWIDSLKHTAMALLHMFSFSMHPSNQLDKLRRLIPFSHSFAFVSLGSNTYLKAQVFYENETVALNNFKWFQYKILKFKPPDCEVTCIVLLVKTLIWIFVI